MLKKLKLSLLLGGNREIHPMAWIPTLYFAEGIPYVIVISISLILYKRLGISNTDAALYTSWLYLPWVIKPLWSPIVEISKTNRWWILSMQTLIGASLAGIAFAIPIDSFFQVTLCLFWLLAFSSATHDVAADGFYMLALNSHKQAMYVGMRSTFYRISTIAGQGLLIILAGKLEYFTANPRQAWSCTFGVAFLLFLCLAIYHYFFLPHAEEKTIGKVSVNRSNFVSTFQSFFAKPGIISAILFMLLYRFPEALLSKISPLFLLDSYDKGGLALTTAELGFVQGTVGVIGLLVGGIVGGIMIAKDGFRKWLWPMVCSISLPNVVYIFLAYSQVHDLLIVNTCVFIEQLGYGFGFTAYMLYLIYFSRGVSATAHYAFCTGFMALSMMVPGLFAGWLQETVGYFSFFVIVMASVPLTFIVAAIIKIDGDFGKK